MVLVVILSERFRCIAAVARPKYSVLYMIADDLRPEFAGPQPYGQSQAHTPSIDRLAASPGAITFAKAYCQQAVCGPSRNSFMTGRRPHHTNVMLTKRGSDFRISGTDAGHVPGNRWITMPEHFKKNNWTTLGGGKTFHPGSPPNFDYPTSWSTEMPYYGYSYFLNNLTTNVSYSGICPGAMLLLVQWLGNRRLVSWPYFLSDRKLPRARRFLYTCW